MSFALRSTSSSFHNNERLKRKRLTTSTLNRFASFNENKSSSAENRRRSFQLTANLIELLEDEEDDIDDIQGVCHECNICSKLFASEYGVNHHMNMHHPSQSVLCSHCHITFRSHRSLKTHQQRRHSSIQNKSNFKNNPSLPNYSYLSSYLVLAFSSKQFPLIAKNACEQQRLPLSSLSSKLYPCHLCSISFPCARTLKYHLLNKHEQYEYEHCEKVLSDIIVQVEFNLRTVNDNNNNNNKNDDDENDIEEIKLILSQQASSFGLIDKQLSKKFRTMKTEQNHLIFPKCQHENRTCANLCLKYLSSYSELIKNYPYATAKIPKGNPFSQGSIVSIITSLNNIYSHEALPINDANTSNDLSNGRQKRKSNKNTDNSLPSSSSSSSPLKKKINSNLTITNSKSNRNNSNNKLTIKQQVNQTTKINDAKINSMEQPSLTTAITSASSVPRKILPKDNYMHTASLSSNSSTSTRSSATKLSSSSAQLTQRTTISSQRSSKRSLSPSVAIATENFPQKRHHTRQQKQNMILSASTTVIKIDDEGNDIEQENGDDDDDDVVAIEVEDVQQQHQNKQRHTSGGSIEYVHALNNDQQSTSASLNNIENLKSKSKIHDEDIIICRSPPSARKPISSSNKKSSSVNGNGTRKSSSQQSPPSDEHVRVRCKICGEILEGRSRFSQHVINMHSNLLKKNITESKQQTAVIKAIKINMSDRDYLPLSTTLVKTLTDKLYEKRKTAALEIEKMVREFMTAQNYEQIERICRILSEYFVLSQNGNFRRGGLIGIAALAIACGKEAQRFKTYLVPPVLQCFLDNDPKVRYYACESLYNIAKVLRTVTLSYFNEIFDSLSKLVCDLEPTVKSGAELCDRLLKDIVIETCSQFEVIAFIPLLRERIYVRNAFTRQFIVSWVSLLTSVPEFDMVQYLPEIMDGLFHILGDPNPEIRKSCEILFSEFLTILKSSQVQPDMFEDMTRILIQNCQSSDELIQYTALHWLREFLNMPKCHQVLLPHSAGLLSAVLPCFSYDDDNLLRQLIKNESSKRNENNAAQNLPDLTITKMVEVLKTQIQSGASPSRIIALGWVHHLFECLQDQMVAHIDVLFPTLFRVLSDPTDEPPAPLITANLPLSLRKKPNKQQHQHTTEAVLLVLQVFALISTSNRTNTDRNYNDYFTKFIIVLMDLFRTDRGLLEARGSFIIRQLCMLLSPEDIYKTLSETLANEPDTNFAAIMVKILSSILLTSTELHDLRVKLKNLQTTESADLFVCLYKTWCHNPIALVALCFLSQNYDHACKLVQLFADIEVTVDFLIEIDKLVQLLESPIFTYLRLALLDVENNQTLIRALCGLLMLLPGKTDAFNVLRRRLECVPNFIDKFTSVDKRVANLSMNAKVNETTNDPRKNINFDELQQYYLAIQNKHVDSKKQRYRYTPTSDGL
ncbi:unnamed protein product [Rotaria socialis]|uniref:Protein VAC14 homolog n=1 Tax=Rotaria socialis TaxID=392032 RepID=A0A817UZP3_9BILA|nr:unnamed protein product [Rotaria socialis]